MNAIDDDRVRRLLRGFVSDPERPRSYAGLSRGSVCQACGNDIKPNEIEYDVVAGKAERRLDSTCYRIFADEIARAEQSA